jgi:hypothetical protein
MSQVDGLLASSWRKSSCRFAAALASPSDPLRISVA